MNNGLFACYFAPFYIGLCIGAWRARRPPTRRGGASGLRITGAIVAVVATLLTGLILLAKLFDSAVLGWMFGLGLMLVFLAMPCAVLFAVGALIGGWLARRRTNAATAANAPGFTIAVDRDGVHASDDEGHVLVKTVRPDLRLSGLLEQLRDDRYLPSIRGGRATWVVESTGNGRQPIAVMAAEWDRPRLVVPDERVADHFAGVHPALYFDYRAQADPATVLSTLGAAMPRGFAPVEG